MTPNKWRFRSSWRGRLILQRLIEWRDDGHDMCQWRDATVEDLPDYVRGVGSAAP